MDETKFQKDIEKYKKTAALARKILGVGENADHDEIKKAYWKLAMKYHPDRFVDDAKAMVENRKRFENIQAAYDFLLKGKDWNPQKTYASTGESSDSNRDKEGYKTDSKWGYFLWWRDRFF